MAFALMILFLGCWLAGQSGVSEDTVTITAEKTDLIHPGTPTTTYPGNTEPGTKSGGRKSPSTLPEIEETDTAGPQQPDPPLKEPAEEERTDSTQSGTTPAPTRPGSTGPGGSERSATQVKTGTIFAGVSAVAAGLFLLLLIFFCYRRKGPAPTQSRESEPATTVYALVGEGKQLNVLPQEPNPGAEGLTYAELDGQVLQAKQGGAAPAPEPALYATINVSQGPDGQSPQGAETPPIDPHSVNPGGVIGETGQGASATTG